MGIMLAQVKDALSPNGELEDLLIARGVKPAPALNVIVRFTMRFEARLEDIRESL